MTSLYKVLREWISFSSNVNYGQGWIQSSTSIVRLPIQPSKCCQLRAEEREWCKWMESFPFHQPSKACSQAMGNIQHVTIIFFCIGIREIFVPMNNQKLLKQGKICKKIVIKSTLSFSQTLRMWNLKYYD